MPMDRSKYPADWEAISAAIRKRDGNCCRFCGIKNAERGARSPQGSWYSKAEIAEMSDAEFLRVFRGKSVKRLSRIVLTVAHLDHDTTNNDESNLAALCQSCHLRHDREQHMRNAAATRRRRKEEQGQQVLLEETRC